MTEARALFDSMPSKDLASWNVEYRNLEAALYIFITMPFCDVGSLNLVISACCKLGKFEYARNYFDAMPNKNVASWTMMIDGYMKSGNVNEAKVLLD